MRVSGFFRPRLLRLVSVLVRLLLLAVCAFSSSLLRVVLLPLVLCSFCLPGAERVSYTKRQQRKTTPLDTWGGYHYTGCHPGAVKKQRPFWEAFPKGFFWHKNPENHFRLWAPHVSPGTRGYPRRPPAFRQYQGAPVPRFTGGPVKGIFWGTRRPFGPPGPLGIGAHQGRGFGPPGNIRAGFNPTKVLRPKPRPVRGPNLG